MAFKITITVEADRQFRSLPVRDQRILRAAILSRLEQQPATPTKAIKRLRPNPLAEFELRAACTMLKETRLSCSSWGERPETS